jgi:hypothetical protein
MVLSQIAAMMLYGSKNQTAGCSRSKASNQECTYGT